MEFTITISEHEASEPGALDGHKMRCSCGTVLGTSLGERTARQLAGEHRAYHAQKKQREAAAEYGRLARTV